jgi:4-amino-4-deoxy-L-arabinose transferase-like glycosyltransferase
VLPAFPTELNRDRQTSALMPIVIPLGFFIYVLLLGRLENPFQYDPDEGLNLMKAALVARGHHLYSEIWSDQPPLDTVIRAGVFMVTGPSALAARIITALLATLAVWAMLDTVARLHCIRAAVAAAVLLMVSAQYLRLSYAVMIGLPALALTMVSLNLLSRWATRGGWVALIGSGLLMAAWHRNKTFRCRRDPGCPGHDVDHRPDRVATTTTTSRAIAGPRLRHGRP